MLKIFFVIGALVASIAALPVAQVDPGISIYLFGISHDLIDFPLVDAEFSRADTAWLRDVEVARADTAWL